MEGIRKGFLRLLCKLYPFNLKGDMGICPSDKEKEVSCIINFYGRINLLEGILYSLAGQDFPRERFEVILIEDRGGTEDGKWTAERFSAVLNIRYHPLLENFGLMGYSRNFGFSMARGRYILFLDDDTVILQKDFLSTLINEFEQTDTDAIIPKGLASYNLIKRKYGFHDPYFPTNRCTAYRREVLEELGGFVSDMIGQEDVEFSIRFIAAGKRCHRSKRLHYLHPPLIMNNLNKAKAVGVSFAGLRRRYPLFIWLLLIVNSARFIPKLLFPVSTKGMMQGRFSLGFLIGVVQGLAGRRVDYN